MQVDQRTRDCHLGKQRGLHQIVIGGGVFTNQPGRGRARFQQHANRVGRWPLLQLHGVCPPDSGENRAPDGGAPELAGEQLLFPACTITAYEQEIEFVGPPRTHEKDVRLWRQAGKHVSACSLPRVDEMVLLDRVVHDAADAARQIRVGVARLGADGIKLDFVCCVFEETTNDRMHHFIPIAGFQVRADDGQQQFPHCLPLPLDRQRRQGDVDAFGVGLSEQVSQSRGRLAKYLRTQVFLKRRCVRRNLEEQGPRLEDGAIDGLVSAPMASVFVALDVTPVLHTLRSPVGPQV